MNLKDMIKIGDVVRFGTEIKKVCDNCNDCQYTNTCMSVEAVLLRESEVTGVYSITEGKIQYHNLKKR
jgi:hypothetical protein